MKAFNIHWIVNNERVSLPMNTMDHLPRVGDEIRAGRKTFFKVTDVVWCLDENHDWDLGQRVNIGLKKIQV